VLRLEGSMVVDALVRCVWFMVWALLLGMSSVRFLELLDARLALADGFRFCPID
jgi:hypothetical protein